MSRAHRLPADTCTTATGAHATSLAALVIARGSTADVAARGTQILRQSHHKARASALYSRPCPLTTRSPACIVAPAWEEAGIKQIISERSSRHVMPALVRRRCVVMLRRHVIRGEGFSN